jgi:hypothetical protein
MAFSNTQLRALKRALKTCNIRTRQAHGRELSYIEGWHAIAEANRIFGFDAWSRETTESKCALSREVRGAFHVVYVAKVRISVRVEEQVIICEGFGTGEAQSATLGEAHDKAIKTAETDATKRALATFGKPFGLALYLGHKTKPRPEENADRPDIERRRTLQRLGPNGRYYVPYSKITPIDPEPAARNAVRAPDKAHANDAAAPVTQTAASTQSTETAPLPPIPVTENTTALAPSSPKPNEIGHKATDLLLPRTPRRREPAHLRYVATQPCLVCGRTPSDAHHLRFAQPRALGRKVSDEFTVPLCRTHHRQLHHGGDEVQWWLDVEIDPLPIARSLWEEFRDQGKTFDTDQTASSVLTAKG